MVEKEVNLQEDEQFTRSVMQANFSAILYLLTEQQAMLGKLFQALLDSHAIDSRQLSEITDTTSEEGGLIPTYTQLYNRFAMYYLRIKQILEQGGDLVQPVDEAKTGESKTDKDEKGEDDE